MAAGTLCSVLVAAEPPTPPSVPLSLPLEKPIGENANFQRPTQPRWTTPPKLKEPEGEAISISDEGDNTHRDARVALTTAYAELVTSETTKLSRTIHTLAAKAESIDELTEIIHKCEEQPKLIDPTGNAVGTDSSIQQLHAWAYTRRGEIRADGGDEHAAFEDFQKALLVDGECWQALHNRGVTLARYAQHLEALADFSRVIELAPAFALARQNRGEVLCQLGRYREAIADYTKAIKRLTDSVTPSEAASTAVEAQLLVARADAYRQLNETNAAVKDYNLALRLDDSVADAYVGRGNLFAERGLYEQAADDFQMALRADPRSAEAYRSVAWLLSTCPLADYRSAPKAVEAAQRTAQLLGEDHPPVLDILAAAYANAGDFPQAIKLQQQAIVLADDGAERENYQRRLALYRDGQPYRTR